MSIKVLKKTLSAKNYVIDLVNAVLTIPYQAAREAKVDVDFTNHGDVTRYRASVEAIIWSNVQIAARLVDICLWCRGLIDDDTKESIWTKLNESANYLIREALTSAVEEECDNENGPLKKPLCDICGRPSGRLRAGHHVVCERCMNEVVQVVFARVTSTDYD